MANFGFRTLSVVAPYAQAWRETRAAVQAGPVVENAKKFKTLAQAIRSSHLVIGTSAGSRRRLDQTWILLDELPSLVQRAIKKGQQISILFGSEKSGLTNAELGFCQAIVKIPTVPECPSMNLAQAVAVVAYALRQKSRARLVKKGKRESISVDNKERLIRRCLDAFSSAKILKGWDLRSTEETLRKSFNRWALDKTDAAMMHRLFRWVAQNASRSND